MVDANHDSQLLNVSRYENCGCGIIGDVFVSVELDGSPLFMGVEVNNVAGPFQEFFTRLLIVDNLGEELAIQFHCLRHVRTDFLELSPVVLNIADGIVDVDADIVQFVDIGVILLELGPEFHVEHCTLLDIGLALS